MNLLRSDQSTLTVDQWNLLSNLLHCYDENAGLSLGAQYMSQQNNLPIQLRFQSSSIISLYQLMLDGAQLLYTNNRDFLSLSTDDRSILLHSTLSYTGSISLNFIVFKIRLVDSPSYYDALEMITFPRIVSMARRFPARLNFDVIVMKLFLAILSFSTCRCTISPSTCSNNLSHVQEVLRIEDRYIELTWRYLLYKYGHKQAVKCFSDFIRCIFLTNEALVAAEELQWFTNIIDSVAQKTEQSFSLND